MDAAIQTAIQGLSDEIKTITTDFDKANQAAKDAQAAQDALKEAQDRQADQATIASLQAAAAKATADVVAALSPVGTALQGLDSHITATLPSTAPPTFTISGRVVDASTPPNSIMGVSITASTGQTATTAADGTYQLTGVPKGSVVVTPSLGADMFAPPNDSLTLNANATGVDFAVAPAAPATP